MDSLDLFSKGGVLLLNKSLYQFKTKQGVLITIIQALLSLMIIITLTMKSLDLNTNIYQSPKIDRKESKILMSFKYPAVDHNYLTWKYSFYGKLLSENYAVNNTKNCSDSEYELFYNNTEKSSDMVYICFTDFLSKDGEKTYSLGKCFNSANCGNYQKLSNNFTVEFYMSYEYFNETDTREELVKIKERKIVNKQKIINYFNLRNSITNFNQWVDDLKYYFWLDKFKEENSPSNNNAVASITLNYELYKKKF